MNLSDEVEAALSGTGTIPRAEYERWIHGDLPTRARAYALTASHWSRIHPEPSGAEHCRFMADYLIECLLQNPEADDFLHNGFEAAHEIAAWLKHLAKTPDGRSVLIEVAGRLASAYKTADPTTRNRIETGALEHALESQAVRPFFDAWGTDPTLREPYEHALPGDWLTRMQEAETLATRPQDLLQKVKKAKAIATSLDA